MSLPRHRISAALFISAMMLLHYMIALYLPIGDDWALFYYGSAAFFDFCLLKTMCHFIDGQILQKIENLFFISIGINFLGWCAYIIYFPPIYYDVLQWMLFLLQVILLIFWDEKHADIMGDNMVSNIVDCWNKPHIKTAYQ